MKITIKHSQTEMLLVFHSRLLVLLFLLATTFLIINFSIFCFRYLRICEPDMFRQMFLPLGFQYPVSSPHDSLIVHSFQGIKRKKKLRDVMAARLLCRCKHLCMLKLHRLSPSKNSIYYMYQANQSDNMISAMKSTFRCSLHVSVVV